jgi:hypothetical protein
MANSSVVVERLAPLQALQAGLAVNLISTKRADFMTCVQEELRAGLDLRTADVGMEPVSSSPAGACFVPLLTFRSAITLHTRITATTMLSRVWRRELSQRAATRFRIVRAPAREEAPGGTEITSSRLTDH